MMRLQSKVWFRHCKENEQFNNNWLPTGHELNSVRRFFLTIPMFHQNFTIMNSLQQAFGNIDIYLFDQLLKGRFEDCKSVVDVGCGDGRNLVWFLQNGYSVSGIDQIAEAIAAIRERAQELAPGILSGQFVVGKVEEMPFADVSFDLAICSAVLHFAKDGKHFGDMLQSIWRVLKPGGYFFARLASDIGIEGLVQPIGDGRYRLPDGSERFLVNHGMLVHYCEMLNGELFEPIKTTNVSNMRCMTTWCLRKK